ncbi:MAG: hypothetical protein HWQ38_37885 [Nostoc sp. NMS7]|uniref:hypothetical protein n=1 Tax=Nostoc sp. NMS7 TaxID=2815391 RepID=UPI0025EE9F13|nr:hypothetical protein [Nostoc sp. NMS7]MBN3951929.1 hypothetical protein [Nostoc sp. NMS7]
MKLDNFLAWALARTITLLPNYLILLKKLEIGVFFFCWRCLRQAKNLPAYYGSLESVLKEQALSEYSHAQVFCQLTGSKLNMSGAGLMSREEKAAFDWGCVNWDSSGESYKADGMSTRYLAAKVFFGFRTANSYDWRNRLAFMYVLEDFQFKFYQQLMRFVSEEVRKELVAIANDEETHAIQLKSLLWNIVGAKRQQQLVFWWQMRLYLALICVPVDVLKFVIGNSVKDVLRDA